MYFIKIVLKMFVYSFYDIVKILVNTRKEYNFIIIYPRILSILLRHVLIFEKNKKNFFLQYVRNYSDILTVYEIFSEEHYNLKKFKIFNTISNFLTKNKKDEQPLILDCGSNIGSSSMYFSKLFSNSKIILIEPDLLSFNFSKKNIKSSNFERINFAISNEKKQIGFYSDINDNRASKISENSNVKINCLTINDVLKKYSDQNFFPFLIKIDIEGHEKELFKSNFEWINDFKIIIIEIHDWMMPNQNNSYTFFKSMSDIMNKYKKRDFLISGENLISIRND